MNTVMGLNSRIQFQMDHRNTNDKDTELDLESGLDLTEDNSKKDSSPGTAKQEKTLFAKVSGGFIGGFLKIEDRPSWFCNKSNLSGVSVDLVHVTNKLLAGQDSVDVEKTLVKEKCKKAGNKKAPKPPRPPQAPSLDEFDQKLVREISKLAMLKRAKIERMKALKKMKASKSSSSTSSIIAAVFTLVFCIVIIFQGVSSGRSSVASVQGSPVSTGAESGLVSVQYHLNPSASNPNAPGSESQNFVQQVAGSDSPEKLRSPG